jgi:hypothetical protein
MVGYPLIFLPLARVIALSVHALSNRFLGGEKVPWMTSEVHEVRGPEIDVEVGDPPFWPACGGSGTEGEH